VRQQERVLLLVQELTADVVRLQLLEGGVGGERAIRG
jgi:hypothetical protein